MTHPVYLVDDDEPVRRALSLLLETVGMAVRTFPSPETLLARIDTLDPGCLILDIRMPVISGLKLQENLRQKGVDWPTVVISGHGDIEACRQAFRNGAIDFLSKPVDEQDLIDAIQKGHAILDASMQKKMETAESRALLAKLTARETEILSLIVKGITSKQIASTLDLSPRTVESHRASISAKFGTPSAAEWARLWLEGDGTP